MRIARPSFDEVLRFGNPRRREMPQRQYRRIQRAHRDGIFNPVKLAITSAAFDAKNGSGTSFTTNSKTWVSNRLYLIFVSNVVFATTPTVAGCTQVTTVNSSGSRITMFCFLGDGTTGTKLVDFGGVTQAWAQCNVDEWQGTDISGTNGNGAIVQSPTNSGISGTCAVTLAAFADPTNNATMCAISCTGTTNATLKAGFTQLSTGTGGANESAKEEWLLGQDTAPNFTQPAGNFYAVIGAEIKAGSTADTFVPPQLAESAGYKSFIAQ